jgi:hypothetical protein
MQLKKIIVVLGLIERTQYVVVSQTFTKHTLLQEDFNK